MRNRIDVVTFFNCDCETPHQYSTKVSRSEGKLSFLVYLVEMENFDLEVSPWTYVWHLVLYWDECLGIWLSNLACVVCELIFSFLSTLLIVSV